MSAQQYRHDGTPAARILSLAVPNAGAHASLPASEFTTTLAGFLDAHSDATPSERCRFDAIQLGEPTPKRCTQRRIGKAIKPQIENQPREMRLRELHRRARLSIKFQGVHSRRVTGSLTGIDRERKHFPCERPDTVKGRLHPLPSSALPLILSFMILCLSSISCSSRHSESHKIRVCASRLSVANADLEGEAPADPLARVSVHPGSRLRRSVAPVL